MKTIVETVETLVVAGVEMKVLGAVWKIKGAEEERIDGVSRITGDKSESAVA